MRNPARVGHHWTSRPVSHDDVTSDPQDSIGTRSAPVGVVSSPVKSRPNGASSPAKSLERLAPDEPKSAKLKPPALTNIAAELTSTMSPPPAKRLALSAKKVSGTRTAIAGFVQSG